MKKIIIVFTSLFVLLSGSMAFAQNNKIKTAQKVSQTDEKVKPVEAYAKQIEDFVEKQGGPHLIIADVADYNEAETPVWKKYASEKEFEKAREQEESYTIAYIWKKDERIVQVNFTYSSPSGDWAEYYFQTYRPDGTLAKVNRELRTFMGDIIVNRINLFDEKGEMLKESITYRDLNTNKPIKPTDNFQDIEAGQIYMNLNKLPFISMLSADAKNDLAGFIPAGWKLEDQQTGDLNGDNRPDMVLQIVNPDTEQSDYNRRLLILFREANGNLKPGASSDKIIRCTDCGGMLGGGPAQVKIEKGVLIISQMYGSREGTDYTHRLRYEPATKRFQLIGDDIKNFDRLTGESESTSTNYLTGKQIVRKMKYDEKTDKDMLVSNQTKTVPRTRKYLEDVDFNNY